MRENYRHLNVVDDSYALTPMQEAYWIGRQSDQALGGVGCQGYFEFDGSDLNVDRLIEAANRLVQRHEMLRARFLPSCRQRIYERSLWEGVTVHDFHEYDDPAAQLLRIRANMTGQRMDAEAGLLFDIQVSLLADRKFRLHIQADLLIADSQSIKILMSDLLHFYTGSRGHETSDERLSFTDYLRPDNAVAEQRKRSKAYWDQTIKDLPGPPALPIAATPESIDVPTFTQRQHVVSEAAWLKFKENSRRHGITPAMALTTAYSEVIGRWSAEKRFLLNLPVLGRWVSDDRIQNIVGDFSNMVLLPVEVASRLPFLERAQSTQVTFRNNLINSRNYFGVEVLRDITRAHPGQPGSAPIVFTYHITDGDFVSEDFRNHFGDLSYTITQTPQVWLDHQVFQLDGCLVLKWDNVAELFPRHMMDDMFAAYVEIVEKLAASSDAWQEEVSIPVPESQIQERNRINDNGDPIRDGGLHESFFRVAATNPDRTALIFEDRTVSYGELSDSALRVAVHLASNGVTQGEAIGVFMSRGIEQIACILGILAAGGAYVPIDPLYPESYCRRVIEGVGVKRVITLSSDIDWPGEVANISYAEANDSASTGTQIGVPSDSPAYIISTSGSTGQPKHVRVSHRAAVNTIDYVNERYDIDERDRAIAMSNFTFDLSVFDIFGPLSVGASLLVLNDNERNDAGTWSELVSRHRVTIWQGVPATLEMLLNSLGERKVSSSLRLALLSGDWVSTLLPSKLAEATDERCHLAVLGGPTETVIWSNIFDVEKASPGWNSIPYGHPLRNQKHRVRDETGNDCCDWVPGELWVGGSFLADGYVGAPELTADRFVEFEGIRWYKTGDIVRYRPGGILEMIGRGDRQVKINGHRVELGEIESTLQSHCQVEKAVTVMTTDTNSPRVVAFVTPAASLVNIADVAKFMRENLPKYSQPTSYFVINDLPLTANRKVDRLALQSWAASKPMHVVGAPPLPGWEMRIAREWSRILDCPVPRRDDDFYALGGDSLLATQLLSRVRELTGLHISSRQLLSAATVRGMAELFINVPIPEGARNV
ncbi:amino acid adenylation domain-containing protein [Streptomyces sp. NPDC087908]|uniref:non-ribosomal peptide synthetase n=1 Tax=Streptomyces sp. NPDC087908 TaxID=3365820 RepID=UPI0038154A48